jgi:hypothetical protein
MASKSSEFWTSPIGGNWAYWSKAAKSIGEFIRGNKLAPVVITPVFAEPRASAKRVIDLGIRGGIRAAHLHFDDKIYLLDAEQWAKFSGSIIAASKARLENVKTVGFEQAMVLGSIAQTLV